MVLMRNNENIYEFLNLNGIKYYKKLRQGLHLIFNERN